MAKPLLDIATRWKMFYFHHYMSVALEGMFAWVVTQVSEKGLAGASVKELAESLKSATVRKALAELFDFDLTEEFGTSTPSDLFQRFVGEFEELDANIGRFLDEKIRPTNAFSEDRLESVIRNRTCLRAPTGLAVPLLLLGVTLARYAQWDGTENFRNWLATASTDPYVDLVPPIVTAGLTRHFGQWWKCQWKDLAEFVLWKYVRAAAPVNVLREPSLSCRAGPAFSRRVPSEIEPVAHGVGRAGSLWQQQSHSIRLNGACVTVRKRDHLDLTRGRVSKACSGHEPHRRALVPSEKVNESFDNGDIGAFPRLPARIPKTDRRPLAFTRAEPKTYSPGHALDIFSRRPQDGEVIIRLSFSRPASNAGGSH